MIEGDRDEVRKLRRLAALLALAAGAVNATGYFAFGTLVTNVTGHFAFISHDSNLGDSIGAYEAVLWVSAFCTGAFVSTILMLPARRRGSRRAYALPITVETLVLAGCLVLGSRAVGAPSARLITVGLLFAMGLQNATITTISGAVVRTTHLTGALTDLGVSLGRLVFDVRGPERTKVLRKLRLDALLVGAFTTGAFAGGKLYARFGFRSLALPVALLAAGLVYDLVRQRPAPR